jgi:bifunctional DNA-binding transcriptional regulator/antitoxin component of YhaV-PrlF toxin-antitoxin module
MLLTKSKKNHIILIYLMREVRMEQNDERVIGRCFGTAVLGPRGQLVIPVEARKELGIDTGSRLLVFGHFGGRGLIFIKAEAAEELLNIMSSRIGEIAKLVEESKTAGAEIEDEGKAR